MKTSLFGEYSPATTIANCFVSKKRFQPTILAVLMASISPFAMADITLTETETLADNQNEPDIVITPSRFKQPISQTPTDVTVISKEEIANHPEKDLNSFLLDKGIQSVQSGGLGQQTSIFLRGSNSNHTIVLNNGTRVNSPVNGITNIQFMNLNQADQIEVVEGASSVLYGSNGIGGVVNIIDKVPTKNKLTASIVKGEHDFNNYQLGASGRAGIYYAKAELNKLDSNGIPIVEKSPIKSAINSDSAKFIIGATDDEHYQTEAFYHYNKGVSQYADGYPASSTKPAQHQFENALAGFKFKINLSQDLNYELVASNFKDHLNQLSKKGHTYGTKDSLHHLMTFTPNEQNTLQFGYEHDKQQADYLPSDAWSTAYQQEDKLNSSFAQYQLNLEKFTQQIGVRYQDSKVWGSTTVGQIASKLFVGDKNQHQFYVNLGTAFVNPTISQLYGGSSSNPLLIPEKSKGIEIGVNSQPSDSISFGVLGYYQDINDLIGYNKAFKLDNIQEAKIKGGKATVGIKLNSLFATKVVYQYTDAINSLTDKQLLRRPKDTVSVQLNSDFGQFKPYLTYVYHGKFEDFSGTQSHYQYANLGANFSINKNLTAFGVLENITNEEIKVASFDGTNSYLGTPRNLKVGIRFSY